MLITNKSVICNKNKTTETEIKINYIDPPLNSPIDSFILIISTGFSGEILIIQNEKLIEKKTYLFNEENHNSGSISIKKNNTIDTIDIIYSNTKCTFLLDYFYKRGQLDFYNEQGKFKIYYTNNPIGYE